MKKDDIKKGGYPCPIFRRTFLDSLTQVSHRKELLQVRLTPHFAACIHVLFLFFFNKGNFVSDNRVRLAGIPMCFYKGPGLSGMIYGLLQKHGNLCR
ncbi:MAG TPA: hypothetical protein VFV68_10440 [Agriterribacter sp.]|nr:hypothetical protein [Agriterribacter sp.]